VPADLLIALNRGEAATASLSESLAIDLALLATHVFPGLPVSDLAEKPFKSKMELIGARLSASELTVALRHPSDTVRGWAAYGLAARYPSSVSELLTLIQPLADDPHFGVREWALIAVRPAVAAQLGHALPVLETWSRLDQEGSRRFSCEVIRPRGVWCKALADLRRAPELGQPILENLRADKSKYVRDSVANYLNDAAKDRPEWVRELCTRWANESPSVETAYIVRRALRTIGSERPTPVG
jgi:3-methyladenine DNA glycosylase AlkC